MQQALGRRLDVMHRSAASHHATVAPCTVTRPLKLVVHSQKNDGVISPPNGVITKNKGKEWDQLEARIASGEFGVGSGKEDITKPLRQALASDPTGTGTCHRKRHHSARDACVVVVCSHPSILSMHPMYLTLPSFYLQVASWLGSLP